MTRENVESLARALPSAAPYFRRVFGTRPWEHAPSEWERVEKALFDPAFGSNVAGSYAVAGQLLPDLEWPVAVRRAYEHWSNPNHADDNLVVAECFNLLDNGDQRGVMRALLACEGGTNELIVDCFQCDAEVVMLFAELYWNVRDRRGEPFYLAHLLEMTHPAGQGLQERRQWLYGRDLLRLAIRTGSAQVVLATAGILPPITSAMPTEVQVEQIVNELLALAAAGLAKGLTSARENPALALVLKYQLLPKTQEMSLANDSMYGFQLSRADLQPLYEDLARRLGLERAITQQVPTADR